MDITTRYLLNIAYKAGYHSAMDTLGNADRITALENELGQLKAQRKNADLQFDLARSHLNALTKQIEILEEQILAARSGQLSFDIRPEPHPR